MKKIALIAMLFLVLVCSMVQADFPRRSRSCSAPSYYPCYHETPVVAAVVPTVTTIIQEPLPTFIFQNLTGYPNLPPSVTQPQQPYAPPTVTNPGQVGSLSDRDIDRLANVILQRLQANQVQQTGLLISPPGSEENQPALQMTQAIANELGSKCASCHQQGLAAKSGLTLFGSDRIWNPQKNGTPYADVRRIVERAELGEMPPSAATDPSKRLSSEAISFLKQLQ